MIWLSLLWRPRDPTHTGHRQGLKLETACSAGSHGRSGPDGIRLPPANQPSTATNTPPPRSKPSGLQATKRGWLWVCRALSVSPTLPSTQRIRFGRSRGFAVQLKVRWCLWLANDQPRSWRRSGYSVGGGEMVTVRRLAGAAVLATAVAAPVAAQRSTDLSRIVGVQGKPDAGHDGRSGGS